MYALKNRMKTYGIFSHFVHINGLTNNNGTNAVSYLVKRRQRHGSFVYLWFIVIISANDGVLCHSRTKNTADILRWSENSCISSSSQIKISVDVNWSLFFLLHRRSIIITYYWSTVCLRVCVRPLILNSSISARWGDLLSLMKIKIKRKPFFCSFTYFLIIMIRKEIRVQVNRAEPSMVNVSPLRSCKHMCEYFLLCIPGFNVVVVLFLESKALPSICTVSVYEFNAVWSKTTFNRICIFFHTLITAQTHTHARICIYAHDEFCLNNKKRS